MEFFKDYCLKVLQNTVNLCFQNELKYRTRNICKIKFLALKKNDGMGRGLSPNALVE